MTVSEEIDRLFLDLDFSRIAAGYIDMLCRVVLPKSRIIAVIVWLDHQTSRVDLLPWKLPLPNQAMRLLWSDQPHNLKTTMKVCVRAHLERKANHIVVLGRNATSRKSGV